MDDIQQNNEYILSQATLPLQHQREILRYITEIGSSLRLHMNINTLLKRIAVATCEALQFRYSALYLADEHGLFHVRATSGISAAQETYLHQHPLPENMLTLLLTREHRVSRSYLISSESPIWQNETIANFFVIVEGDSKPATTPLLSHDVPLDNQWQSTDLLIVPLINAENTLLGFLTPDAPLNNLRPTSATMELLEALANQAAVVIEGARLYEEARRVSEERAALIEIGHALSDLRSLRDLQTVYRTIYQQVKMMMLTDVFFVALYQPADDSLFIDYLIDEEVLYPSEAYGPMPLWVHKLLEQKHNSYHFDTYHQYERFAHHSHDEDVQQSNDLIGSMRPAESSLFVPIYYGNEAIGILSVQCYTPSVYTHRHSEILREISLHAGIAIANARLYEELHSALEQAQESEKLKNHFLMAASHELRTPLTAIQGYLELLTTYDTSLSQQVKTRFVINAQRATEELVLLLSNVMDTSRIDQDSVQLNLSSVSLKRTVQAILEILEPALIRERRNVEVAIADDLFGLVDDLRLRQILMNIMTNALKYTPAGTKLAISATSIDQQQLTQRLPTQLRPPQSLHEQFVLIVMRDWGNGILPEDQGHLFTKFIRLPNAINSAQRGAGLGLYLCRQLTEAMGGCIWVESSGEAGDGSTFCIAVPQSTTPTKAL